MHQSSGTGRDSRRHGHRLDTLSPEGRSERMSRVRNKNTKPELRVRRLIHGMGYRYRLHRKDIPGRPDLVFPSRKRVIFVHGCFWHRHPHCGLARLPKSRREFWVPKLEGNRTRDLANQHKLHELGWKVLVVWECQTTARNLDSLAERIQRFLESGA